MLRWLLVVAGATALLVVDTSSALAQPPAGNWPAVPFNRGPGAYLSPWKIFAYWMLFLAWVRTTDWVSQDAQLLKLKHGTWNPIVFFSFFAAILLFFLLPWFIAGYILMLIAWIAPLTTYIVYRNKAVQSYDRVLTAKHIKRWIARKVSAVGIKIEGADIDPRDMGPDVKLSPRGGDERANNVNLLTARQSPGWIPSRELIDDALAQRATHVMLDYTAEAVAVRYQIDGVWLDRAPMDRPNGDAILGVYKGLSALKIDDRRARQKGTFGVEAKKQKIDCKLTSQGTQTGERALLQFAAKNVEFRSLEELGMRPKMQEQLDAILAQNGVFVFASLPAGGLSTTMDMVFSHMDRFVRSFVEVHDEARPERDIENVAVTTYSSPGGQTPMAVLPTLIRQYPDVVIVREVTDLETLTLLVEQVEMDRLVMFGVRAKEAVEALLRILMLKIPPADFAQVVTGVLNVRLVRMLCEQCKEAYPPPPEVLKQLGLPAGKIENLYRTPTQPIDPKHPEVVCDKCNGVGYYGRTAIFELLTVDDTLRQALATTPKLDILRQVARKAKHRTLQEEGVLLVARGATSIQELLRALKQ
jgi:type II secretory ATPase GspE/PulE/Tfp pilus assembly ATPase PilB-like protein